MNKETLSATPENEPTDKQWEDPEIPKNMEDMPLRIDLNSEAFQSKFADAEIMAKKGTINAEQITEDGLQNGNYEDIYFDDADGKYKMSTYVMEGEGEDRHRRLENTHDVVPGMWIATNPKQQESDYPNSYPIEDEKFHKLYEASGEDGVYKAKGLAKLIPNETNREVEIELPESWGGGLMSGAKDCFFRQPCDIDGNPTGRPSIIAADAVESTYGPLAEVRPDLVQDDKESGTQKQLSPTVQRFIYGTVEKGGSNIGDRSQRKERWGSYTDADSSKCDYERFQYLVQDGVIGVAKAAEFLETTAEHLEAADPDKAMEIMGRIDAVDPEKGKTDTDVYHERKIIGYLLDGANGERSASDSDRWNNPDEVDNGAVFEVASKYPTPLDFRKDAIKLIQNIWAGSENDSENEAKREEYRRAERDLEKNIYGEEQVERTNELMDALAEAGALKHSGKVYFPRVRSHEEAKYCIVDQSGETPHRRRQLFQYDSNLRLRPEYGNLG